MSYDPVLSVRVPVAVHNELKALAEQRGRSVGELVRSILSYELDDGLRRQRERREEALDQVLFTAIAVEGLLDRHTDPNLRAQVLQVWRDRLDAEGRGDARA